jgi:hypothetical protein
LINKEIFKFAKKVKEEFPQIPIDEMLAIWCKQQQICGFEIPSLDNDSEDSVTDSGANAFSVTDSGVNAFLVTEENKICQPMYTKGKKANTQCTTKVKGKGDYCSKNSKT